MKTKQIVKLSVTHIKTKTKTKTKTKDNVADYDTDYFYVYNPSTVHVDKKNTKIIYQLSEETDKNFVIDEIFFNDPTGQIKNEPKLSKDRREISFIVTNHVPKKRAFLSPLIDLLIRVHDQEKNVYVSCDPQVTCSPARKPTASDSQ